MNPDNMKPLELANKYMEIMFSSKNLDHLHEILASDLVFKGPLFEFNSAQAYVDSLKSDPPVGFEYSILHAYQDEDSACLFYKFSKPGVEALMAQTFEIKGGKIKKIHLVFDTRQFK